ncbi:hypothetical protein C4D27_17025 [Clostridium perfringens]
MTKIFRDDTGSISLTTIMIMSVLLPFLIFVFVDMSQVSFINKKLQNITDNSASSAILALNNNDVENGKIYIDSEKANLLATEIVRTSLNLNKDLTPKNKDVLYGRPKIVVKVFNDIPEDGLDIKIGKSNTHITNPSVLVSVDYPVHLSFFKFVRFNIVKSAINDVRI